MAHCNLLSCWEVSLQQAREVVEEEGAGSGRRPPRVSVHNGPARSWNGTSPHLGAMLRVAVREAQQAEALRRKG